MCLLAATFAANPQAQLAVAPVGGAATGVDARVAGVQDDLQYYGGIVARAVLLCRHCDSELIGPVAVVGDPG